jgi:salicylate hydroxylase
MASGDPIRTTYDIGIAGCGPAGLAAALLLHRDGHRVTLYERFATPRPIGSGLMLQPSGMAVLARLGLAETVAGRGARIDALLGIEEHGRVALDAPYAKLGVADAFGIGIHRASLFGVLFEAARAENIAIRTGHEIVASRSVPSGRCLAFADGAHSPPHDLIVDASGWASRIAGGEQRGLLPFGALWASLPVKPGDGFARNLLEQRYRRAAQMVGVLPIGSRGDGAPQEVAFFWSLRRADHARWREAPLDQWKDEVRTLWPQVDFLLDRIASHNDLTFAQYAHRTARKPQGDRSIRIGDAWHSASPQLGQGANMALLDAWGLAAGLREGASLAEGLRLTGRWRREHVALYQLVTAAFTPMFQSDAALWPWLRDRVMAPLSRFGPVAHVQAQLMSGLFGWPLQTLGLALPDYPAMASSMAARASSPDQSNSPVTRHSSLPDAS